jgi:tetratricopeptide (TPR) repeat protein
VAPAERNALDLLLKLRALDPNNETTARLGSAVASAIRKEAREAKPEQVATLEAAAQQAQATPSKGAGLPKPDGNQKVAEDATREGTTLLAAGDFAGARRAFDRAIAANGRWHPALGGIAEAAFNSGDFTFAVLSAKRAIDVAPRVVAYRMTLAKAYYKLSRYQDALDAYNGVLAIEPGNTTAKNNADMVRRKLGQ